LRSNAPTRIYCARRHRCTRCSVLFQDSSARYHTLVSDVRQGITWVTYKQEYLLGSPPLSLSLSLSLSFSAHDNMSVYMCTLCSNGGKRGRKRGRVRERERERERETLCIGFAGQWVVASCSHRFVSPRLATRHSSPGVTAARFIASVNLRRLTSHRVSGYLPTYLPIHVSIGHVILCRSALQRACMQVVTRRALPFCLPLYFPASELHATHDSNWDSQPLRTMLQWAIPLSLCRFFYKFIIFFPSSCLLLLLYFFLIYLCFKIYKILK